MSIVMNPQRMDEFFADEDRPKAIRPYDRLMQWAEHLTREDQLLLELVVSARLTRQKAAEVLGVPRGTVTRRLHRIARWLFNPLALALLDEKCSLPPDQRELAIAHLVRHEPMSHLARRLSKPLREVRDILAFVRGWHRGAVLGTHRPGKES